MTWRAKFWANLGTSKAVSFTSKNARSPATDHANFSAVARHLEQVKAYDCYKSIIIKRKIQVLFIDQTEFLIKTQKK